MCKCFGNQECDTCYTAMVAAFNEAYSNLKKIGMEDSLEAKEFMWEFYAKRDSEKAESHWDEVRQNELESLQDKLDHAD